MTGWRGILAGALLLAALERLVSRPASAERAGGLFEAITRGVDHFLSPDYPFFPPKGAAAPSTSSPGSVAPATPTQPAPAGATVPNYPSTATGAVAQLI